MRVAKVSKNLIYYYFGSKEELFIAVLESAYEGMHAYQDHVAARGCLTNRGGPQTRSVHLQILA